MYGGWYLNKQDVVPNSKVHGANMEPTWGRQGPGGSHVGPMNLAIWGFYMRNEGCGYGWTFEHIHFDFDLWFNLLVIEAAKVIAQVGHPWIC